VPDLLAQLLARVRRWSRLHLRASGSIVGPLATLTDLTGRGREHHLDEAISQFRCRPALQLVSSELLPTVVKLSPSGPYPLGPLLSSEANREPACVAGLTRTGDAAPYAKVRSRCGKPAFA
jgi:hypothetical protein